MNAKQMHSAIVDSEGRKNKMKADASVRLLLAAGALMLLAGGLFAILQRWIYAALLGAGALGCLTAAICFKNRKE